MHNKKGEKWDWQKSDQWCKATSSTKLHCTSPVLKLDEKTGKNVKENISLFSILLCNQAWNKNGVKKAASIKYNRER